MINELRLKKKEINCSTFFYVGCLLGIVFPLFAMLGIFIYHKIPFVSEETSKDVFYFLVLFLIVLVAIIPFIASRRYRTQKNETITDISLYILAILSIVGISIIVHYTGGIRESLMSFYFLFIPSAVAVAFKARIGLIVILLTSLFALFFLHTSSSGEITCKNHDVYKKTCLIFHMYQIILICVLELITNFRMNNFEKEQLPNNE